MSETEVQAKVKLYEDAFKSLYAQAVQDIQKVAGTQAQASQAGINELTEKVRETMFGYRRGKDFKVEKD